MKSLQICLLSALLVIAASNPVPADEPTVTPVVPDVTPAVKTVPEQPVVPAVAATEVPSTVKSLPILPIDNEKIPEPQALPSKKEEAAPIKAEEKKREVAVEQPEQVTGKSLPEQPIKEVIAEASTPKVEPQPAESNVKSVVADQPVEPTPTVPAVVVPEAKQADVKQAIESTVVPVVPSAIASEKKIDAEAPVPIVSDVQPAVENVQPEQKSVVAPEPAQVAPIQDAPVQAEAQALSQPQERSAPEPVVPIAAASSVEPAATPVDVSSSASSEKKLEDDSSSSSSEETKESKESQEEPEKKPQA